MTESKSSDSCIDCGESLELYPASEPRPPCPKCGSLKRHRNVSITEKITIKETIDVIHEGERKKTSYPLLITSFIIVGVGSFAGYYVTGSEMGVFVGLILGFVAWYVGKDAIDKGKFRNHFHKE